MKHAATMMNYIPAHTIGGESLGSWLDPIKMDRLDRAREYEESVKNEARLAVILDEATGIPNGLYEAVQSMPNVLRIPGCPNQLPLDSANS